MAEKKLQPVQRFKNTINDESVQEQFRNALKDGAPLFTASLIDIFANDKALQECEPKDVVMEALKAATLKLPINKQLGFGFIVPYKLKDHKNKKIPQFQIGYKGYLQLAQRTGQYKYINADVVYEGELKSHDKLSGALDLSGERASDKIVGYFAHMETVSGFRKTVYWTKEQVTHHAQRFSKSYGQKNSPWKTDFDAMALKTLLRALLSKYGVMSVELISAMTADTDERTYDERVAEEIQENANSETIDIEAEDEEEEEGPDY